MRLFLNAILSLFVASFLSAGTPAAAATATATITQSAPPASAQPWGR